MAQSEFPMATETDGDLRQSSLNFELGVEHDAPRPSKEKCTCHCIPVCAHDCNLSPPLNPAPATVFLEKNHDVSLGHAEDHAWI